MDKTYTAAEVRRIFKADRVTQRKLDYWDEQGFLSPSGAAVRAEGSKCVGRGAQRRYTYTDLVKLKVLVELRRAGLSLQNIQKGLRKIATRDPSAQPLLETLVTDGKRFLLKRRDGKFEDLLAGGQLVFAAVALDHVHSEVAGRVLKFERQTRPSRRKSRKAR
jgi:DNA-binding transcriptional MerR regulator